MQGITAPNTAFKGGQKDNAKARRTPRFAKVRG
jgi:hypothetical protein